MSQEILDDLIDELAESEQEELPSILEKVLYFNFLDDTQLSTLLDLDLTDIDELLTSAEHLTVKEWKLYRKRILASLKKERKRYERLYYKSE